MPLSCELPASFRPGPGSGSLCTGLFVESLRSTRGLLCLRVDTGGRVEGEEVMLDGRDASSGLSPVATTSEHEELAPN